jgi:hypothetical protein
VGFYADYKAVFDAIKTAIGMKSTIKTVVLGEQFTMSPLPKAIISADPSPIKQFLQSDQLDVKVRGNIVLVILSHEPADWFVNIIAVMGDVVDAILADRTLGGVVSDCIPTSFIPGEVKFKEQSYYGGEIRFEATMYHEP